MALYCAVEDVIRKFNPQLTRSALEQGDYIGSGEDLEQVRARIEAVSAEFDDLTRRALRERRVGSPGTPATYEYQDARHSGRGRRPVRVSLDHDNIVPLDPSAGDEIAVRTGKDSWRDITSQEGSKFSVNYRKGTIKLWTWLRQLIWWDAPDDRYLRACYRYGALGGNQNQGGQTALTSAVTDSDTVLSVEAVGRLPASGSLLVGDAEYVRIEGVDYDNDELTVTRGVRSTPATAHSSGDVVHYCPENVRDAVAGKTAEELLRYDDWVDELIDANGVGAQAKLDDWESEWETALAKHSGVKKL